MPSREIGIEEPVHFYAKTSKGALKTISLRVVKNISKEGKAPYELAYVESSESSRGWGSTAAVQNFSVDDGCSASFSLHRLGSGERFRLNVQVSEQSSL